MLEISLDNKNRTLEVIAYNGDLERREIFPLKFDLKEPSYAAKWNFFRQGNNHAYVKGSISYEGDCKNNIIISPYLNNKLVNVKNAFVFVRDSFVEISPMSNISNAIDKGKKNYPVEKLIITFHNLFLKEKI